MIRNKESMLDCQRGFAILTGLFERMRGLKDPALRAGTTVVLAPCRDIHTVGMAEAVDVAFVDKGGVVVGVHRSVSPGRRLRCIRAKLTIERASRPGKWYEIGDRALALPSSESLEQGLEGEGHENMSDL